MPAAIPIATMALVASQPLAVQVLAGLAASVVAGYLDRALFAPEAAKAEAGQGIEILWNVRDTQEPIRVVYGRRKVGGNDVFMETVGSDNQTLWIVQSLSEGECSGIHTVESVDQIFLGDELVSTYPSSLVSYWFHAGTSTQTYDTNLNAAISKWNDNMRYTSYIVWKLKFDRDWFQSLPTRTLVLNGKKVVDFRVGGDPVWSDNPVLCLYDYLTNARYGLGIATSKLDTTSWTAAANYCDTKGWTLNYTIRFERSAKDIIDTICAHFRGHMVWYDGKFYLRYADLTYETSLMTLGDEHIVRDSQGRDMVNIGEPSRFGRPDGLQVTYVDPDRGYVEDTFPIGDATGDFDSIRFLGCTNRQQAADLAVYALERRQLDRGIGGTFRGDALKLEPHDVITFNSTVLAVSNQLMRVQEVNPLEDEMVELVLIYESTDLYNDNYDLTTEDEYNCDLPDPTAEPPSVEDALCTEEVYDYRLRSYTRLRVTFNPPANYPWFDHVEVRLSKTPTGHWKFDASAGTEAIDSSGHDNSGTLEGGMGDSNWVTGKIDKCLDFDGIDDRVDFGNPAPLSELGKGDWSLAAWIKSDTIKSNGKVFSKYEDANNFIEVQSNGTNNKLEVHVCKNGVDKSNVFDDLTPFDGSWHLINVACSRTSNKVYAFVDKAKSAEELDLTGLPDDCSNAGSLAVGARHDGTSPSDMKIDDPRTYNIAVSQTDVNYTHTYPGAHAYEHIFNATTDFEIDTIQEGMAYWVRLKTVSLWGTKQKDASDTLLQKTVLGYADVPTSLSALYAIVNQNTINLYANKVADPDVELYEFRLGTSWSGAIFLYAGRAPNMSLFGVKPGGHTFLANTLANNQLYGATPRSSSVSLKDPPDGWSVVHTEVCNYDGIGTHDNTEHVIYSSEDHLKCSHTGGVLTGTYKSPIYDRGASGRYLTYVLADIVVTGTGTLWDSQIPLVLTGSTLVLNGNFSSWSGGDPVNWTESNCEADEDVSGETGSAVQITLSAAGGYIYQNITVTAGKWHRIDGYYKNTAGDQAAFGFYDVSNGAWITPLGLHALKDASSWTAFSYLFKAPTGCTSVQVRLGGISSGDIVGFDTIVVKEVDETNSTKWSDINISSRTWCEIFELSAGPSVSMKLKYGDTTPPTNEVSKMEILSTIAAGRYFQVEITITDPSDAINALVEEFTLKFCQ